MALTSDQQAALTRLANFYEGLSAYNASSNPGGFRQGGHLVNFVPALKDLASVVQGTSSLVADALAAATNSPKAVRVDSNQGFSSAEMAQALKNIGLDGLSATLSSINDAIAAANDSVGKCLRFDADANLSAGERAQALKNLVAAAVSASSASSIAATDNERTLRLTGATATTHTLPAASSIFPGWHSRYVINEGTAIKTIAVQSGDYLDGVQNGTVLLFPRQRAQFAYDTDGWRTVWIDRSPILAQVNQPGVASVDLALPIGYGHFEILLRGAEPAVSGATLGARLSDDGGATFKAGVSDYAAESFAAQGNSIQGTSPTNTFFNVIGSIQTGYGGGHGRLDVQPNASGFYPTLSSRSGNVAGGSYFQQRLEGICSSISANRANALRLLWTGGTGPIIATMRGIP